MLFEVNIVPGRDYTQQLLVQRRRIQWNSFGAAISSFAGSCHIRDMGGHFLDYMVNFSGLNLQLGSARGFQGFPQNTRYQPLTDKLRSSGVSGNLGEMIAGIVGTRVFQLNPQRDIVHVRATTTIKAPDFIFIFRGLPLLFEQAIESVNGSPIIMRNAPNLWPVEVKTGLVVTAAKIFNDALLQHLVFWRECVDRNQALTSVGYGLIIIVGYGSTPGTINVHLLVPTQPASLISDFRSPRYSGMTNKQFKNHFKPNETNTDLTDFKRRHFHGFS